MTSEGSGRLSRRRDPFMLAGLTVDRGHLAVDPPTWDDRPGCQGSRRKGHVRGVPGAPPWGPGPGQGCPVLAPHLLVLVGTHRAGRTAFATAEKRRAAGGRPEHPVSAPRSGETLLAAVGTSSRAPGPRRRQAPGRRLRAGNPGSRYAGPGTGIALSVGGGTGRTPSPRTSR